GPSAAARSAGSQSSLQGAIAEDGRGAVIPAPPLLRIRPRVVTVDGGPSMRTAPLLLSLVLVACGARDRPDIEHASTSHTRLSPDHIGEADRKAELDRALVRLHHGVGSLENSAERIEIDLLALSEARDPALRAAVGSAQAQLE